MTKILMTYSSTEGLEELLSDKDFQVEIVAKPSPEKFLEIIPNYEGLLIRSEVKVTKEVMDAGKNLKLVLRAGTGVDNVDREYATQKGIVVMNVPGGNTISAAEHTVAMLLALSRNIPQAYSSMKAGEWKREKFIGTELQGKVLGLIGLGRIGKEVAKRAQSFEVSVIAYDPFLSEDYAKSINVGLKTLDEIYAESDYISIHSPLNDTTRNLVNKSSIDKMKEGVRIINCARGGIINENDLADALKSGRVKGAAVDVFEKEPIQKDSPLLGIENIVVTPHLGASTEEAQVKIAKESGSMIIDFFKKGIIRNAVNMPSIDMETYKRLSPFISLAEKIGSLQSQLNDFGIKEVEIQYSGEISKENTSIITGAYLKGLLTPILDIKVNFVNVGYLAKERKIKVKEVKVAETEDYTSMISAKIITEKGELPVSGTLFAHQLQRIVSIKGLDVDVVPQGCMLVVENIDRPGVIGSLGTLLGNGGINIASMQVGRNKIGGEAITIINIDTCPTDGVMKNIAKVDGITKAKLVQF